MELSEADLDDTRVGDTIVGNIDLGEVKGLETVIYEGPSTINIDTIYCSEGH